MTSRFDEQAVRKHPRRPNSGRRYAWATDPADKYEHTLRQDMGKNIDTISWSSFSYLSGLGENTLTMFDPKVELSAKIVFWRQILSSRIQIPGPKRGKQHKYQCLIHTLMGVMGVHKGPPQQKSKDIRSLSKPIISLRKVVKQISTHAET